MSKLRSFALVLLVIAILILVGGLFAKRMADLGQDINEVTPST